MSEVDHEGHIPDVTKEDMAAVTIAEFLAYLDERVVVHSCPTCTQNDWSIINDDVLSLGIPAFRKDGALVVPMPNVPVMGVACKHCGHIRSHALRMIAEWKLSKIHSPKSEEK